MLERTALVALLVSTPLAGQVLAQSSAQPRTVELTVAPEVSDADMQRISQNVNRFFKLPPVSIGGQVTTPLGGGGVIINLGRSGAAPTQARSLDVAQFSAKTVDDYERDIFKDIACNAAAAAAAAACPGSGIALAACLAAVEAARQACMR